MTDKKQVTIEIEGKSTKFGPDSKLVVVKMASIIDHKSGAEWPERGPRTINGPEHKLTPITVEAGVSMVSPALWARHVEAKNPNMEFALKGVKIYGSISAMAKAYGVGDLVKVVNASRHGLALRKLYELEQDAERPRPVLMESLAKRRQLYGGHSPTQFDTVAEMPVRQRAAG